MKKLIPGDERITMCPTLKMITYSALLALIIFGPDTVSASPFVPMLRQESQPESTIGLPDEGRADERVIRSYTAAMLARECFSASLVSAKHWMELTDEECAQAGRDLIGSLNTLADANTDDAAARITALRNGVDEILVQYFESDDQLKERLPLWLEGRSTREAFALECGVEMLSLTFDFSLSLGTYQRQKARSLISEAVNVEGLSAEVPPMYLGPFSERFISGPVARPEFLEDIINENQVPLVEQMKAGYSLLEEQTMTWINSDEPMDEEELRTKLEQWCRAILDVQISQLSQNLFTEREQRKLNVAVTAASSRYADARIKGIQEQGPYSMYAGGMPPGAGILLDKDWFVALENTVQRETFIDIEASRRVRRELVRANLADVFANSVADGMFSETDFSAVELHRLSALVCERTPMEMSEGIVDFMRASVAIEDAELEGVLNAEQIAVFAEFRDMMKEVIPEATNGDPATPAGDGDIECEDAENEGESQNDGEDSGLLHVGAASRPQIQAVATIARSRIEQPKIDHCGSLNNELQTSQHQENTRQDEPAESQDEEAELEVNEPAVLEIEQRVARIVARDCLESRMAHASIWMNLTGDERERIRAETRESLEELADAHCGEAAMFAPIREGVDRILVGYFESDEQLQPRLQRWLDKRSSQQAFTLECGMDMLTLTYDVSMGLSNDQRFLSRGMISDEMNIEWPEPNISPVYLGSLGSAIASGDDISPNVVLELLDQDQVMLLDKLEGRFALMEQTVMPWNGGPLRKDDLGEFRGEIEKWCEETVRVFLSRCARESSLSERELRKLEVAAKAAVERYVESCIEAVSDIEPEQGISMLKASIPPGTVMLQDQQWQRTVRNSVNDDVYLDFEVNRLVRLELMRANLADLIANSISTNVLITTDFSAEELRRLSTLIYEKMPQEIPDGITDVLTAILSVEETEVEAFFNPDQIQVFTEYQKMARAVMGENAEDQNEPDPGDDLVEATGSLNQRVQYVVALNANESLQEEGGESSGQTTGESETGATADGAASQDDDVDRRQLETTELIRNINIDMVELTLDLELNLNADQKGQLREIIFRDAGDSLDEIIGPFYVGGVLDAESFGRAMKMIRESEFRNGLSEVQTQALDSMEERFLEVSSGSVTRMLPEDSDAWESAFQTWTSAHATIQAVGINLDERQERKMVVAGKAVAEMILEDRMERIQEDVDVAEFRNMLILYEPVPTALLFDERWAELVEKTLDQEQLSSYTEAVNDRRARLYNNLAMLMAISLTDEGVGIEVDQVRELADLMIGKIDAFESGVFLRLAKVCAELDEEELAEILNAEQLAAFKDMQRLIRQ
ncbi:MAG: hypothetical protein AAF456_21895, partial [Planctomycetota bacterium]